jgi:hypothetical protein
VKQVAGLAFRKADHRVESHGDDRHARSRLRQWLRRKHKVAGRGVARFPDRYLHQDVRFDERDVETEQGVAIEAPTDERTGNR